MQVTNDTIQYVARAEPPAPYIRQVAQDSFLVHAAPAVINTIRRIVLDETPTLAFDTAVIQQNTSVMPDEVLCQRFAMLPLNFDPRLFDFQETSINELNTVIFTVDVTCAEDFCTVYSDNMQFKPLGQQAQRFAAVQHYFCAPRIPLVKLRKGQQLKAEVYAHKGIGKTHAKFSPVSVCFYQQICSFRCGPDAAVRLNEESLKAEFVGAAGAREAAAQKLSTIQCPVHVFDDLEDIKLLSCTLCRKCLGDGLELFLDDGAYILRLESTCALSAREILAEALKVMKTKAALVVSALVE